VIMGVSIGVATVPELVLHCIVFIFTVMPRQTEKKKKVKVTNETPSK